MESSEPPKGNAESVNKELELKAVQLAGATREKGMGHLMGKFPSRFLKHNYQWESFTHVGQFIQGEIEAADKHINNLGLMIKHRSINDELHKNYQIWLASNYAPPTKILTVKEPREEVVMVPRRFGPLKLKGKRQTQTYYETVRKTTDEILTHNDKHGERGWTQYDYCMTSEQDLSRGGSGLVMSIVVPPEIAIQIDEQVNNNVYFPDVFLKALYPDYIGSNTKTHIKRLPATHIRVEDLRQKPNKNQIIKYPQPIPY